MGDCRGTQEGSRGKETVKGIAETPARTSKATVRAVNAQFRATATQSRLIEEK